MRPANSCELAGRKLQGRFGITRVAGTDLRIVTYGRSRTSKVVLLLTGEIKSAANNEISCRIRSLNSAASKELCIRKSLTIKHLKVLASLKVYLSPYPRQAKLETIVTAL